MGFEICDFFLVLALGLKHHGIVFEKVDSIHVRYNEGRMLRFSIKTMVFVTTLVATYFGALLSASGKNPLWAILPLLMYYGLIIGWCVYREINEDKPSRWTAEENARSRPSESHRLSDQCPKSE